ncbi:MULTISPECIES: LacI family DNA-binding transcriptional regulator [Eubacteriales]|uniref:LacI family DNA-binding transcriptional regulator n=1 Tax=Eubacteriales TaxID=186802 RepID=UPI001FAA2E5B|nr:MULTISPECIES: LacI family DNA-binding transcriptional regulator [Eubacteriales]
MKCTIKQLAEELGLSRNTVAKALKNSSDVSAKTKQIVLAKAKELNYKKLDPDTLSQLPKQEEVSDSPVTNGSILFSQEHMQPIPNSGQLS